MLFSVKWDNQVAHVVATSTKGDSIVVAKFKKAHKDTHDIATEMVTLLNRWGSRMDKLPWETICAAYGIFLEGYKSWEAIERFLFKDTSSDWTWIE